MRVRVIAVISRLVMDRAGIPGDALAQAVGKRARQGFPLVRGGLHRQGHHKPLTDPPLAPPSLVLGQAGGLGVGGPR
ncbi:MAG: hypothetical protein CMI67_12795 [Pelagibaca sp.]|nr:hypothetical protein [Pelagibaca sp.]